MNGVRISTTSCRRLDEHRRIVPGPPPTVDRVGGALIDHSVEFIPWEVHERSAATCREVTGFDPRLATKNRSPVESVVVFHSANSDMSWSLQRGSVGMVQPNTLRKKDILHSEPAPRSVAFGLPCRKAEDESHAHQQPSTGIAPGNNRGEH